MCHISIICAERARGTLGAVGSNPKHKMIIIELRQGALQFEGTMKHG